MDKQPEEQGVDSDGLWAWYCPGPIAT
jgi:hypothetical protein